MLKVAWPAFADSRWTGGLNYFRNLALAVKSIPNPRIEIILLNSGEHLPPPLDSQIGAMKPASTPRMASVRDSCSTAITASPAISTTLSANAGSGSMKP